MISPYFTGGGAPSFGPPAGLASLLAQPAQIAAQDRATGSHNMATLVQMVADHSEKQGQIDDAGKAAKLMMAGDNSDGQSWLQQRGVTPDVQKTWGTKDWANAGAAFHDDQVSKEADVKVKTGLSQLSMFAQQAQAQAQRQGALQQFTKQYNAATAPTLNTGDDNFSMFSNIAAGNGVNPGPTMSGPDQYNLALRSGLTPPDALDIAKGAQEIARAQKEATTPAGKAMAFIEDPISGKRFGTFGNSVLPSGDDPALAKSGVQMIDDGRGGQMPVLFNPKTGGAVQVRTGAATDDELMRSYQRDTASLRAQLPFIMDPEEKTNVLQQIQANTDAVTAVRQKGQPAASAASTGKMTQAKYDALAKGATYVGNDGKTYRKP